MIRAPWWGAPVGWALLAVLVAWWLPSLVLAVASLAAGRLRFLAISAVVDVLRALGLRGAARAVLHRELRRVEQRMAALARTRPGRPGG